MPQMIDEETPLLRNEARIQRTPLPWRQFSILLLLQISEPITSQVISPFLPQLIRDIGVTNGKESLVPYYVGLMHSLFFFTEACTIYHWSRMSDQIGRKPIVLMGLFGLSASMWCFGLSRTFWGLVVSRCLNGALNGNVGVMKSMVVEITDTTNLAQAWGIIPITWSIGTTAGPLIGGSFARPAERFPDTFGHSAFLKEYPYFLPCAVSASITAISWLVTLFCMKETRKTRITLRQYLFGGATLKRDAPIDNSQSDSDLHNCSAAEPTGQPVPFRALLVRPVIIAAGSYGAFSLVDIAFHAIFPVFCAIPIGIGGLNLDPPAIGNVLAFFGISGGIIQWLFFVPMHDWLGPKLTFLTAVSLCFPITALFPIINAAARVYGLGYRVWLLLGLQNTLFIFAGFAFGISPMYISAAAPNKASIGATNGLAQVVGSIMRAVGPAIINSAFSLSIEKNIMGGCFAYWVMAVTVGLTMWVGYLLPRQVWNESSTA